MWRHEMKFLKLQNFWLLEQQIVETHFMNVRYAAGHEGAIGRLCQCIVSILWVQIEF
jgi:hypothetical protein